MQFKSLTVRKHLSQVYRFLHSKGSSMVSNHLYISSHITDLAITKRQWYRPNKSHRPHCYWHMPLILWMLQKMKISSNPQNSHPGESFLSKSWYYFMLTKEGEYVIYLIKVRSCLPRLQSFDSSLAELFDVEFHIINANFPSDMHLLRSNWYYWVDFLPWFSPEFFLLKSLFPL